MLALNRFPLNVSSPTAENSLFCFCSNNSTSETFQLRSALLGSNLVFEDQSILMIEGKRLITLNNNHNNNDDNDDDEDDKMINIKTRNLHLDYLKAKVNNGSRNSLSCRANGTLLNLILFDS